MPATILLPEAGNPEQHHPHFASSIGIRYEGVLETETSGLERHRALVSLLADLRSHYPEALILGMKEIEGKNMKASKGMNRLRFELSNYP